MKASNDGHNRLIDSEMEQGSILHIYSERERDRKKESLAPTFQIVFVVFFFLQQNENEKRKKKRGRTI